MNGDRLLDLPKDSNPLAVDLGFMWPALAALILLVPAPAGLPDVCVAGTCASQLTAPPGPEPAPEPAREPTPEPASSGPAAPSGPAPQAPTGSSPEPASRWADGSAPDAGTASGAVEYSAGGLAWGDALVTWTALSATFVAVASAAQGRLLAAAGRAAVFGLGGLLGFRLFSRIEGPKVLEHPTRAALADLIAREPGVHVEDLRRRLDISTSTAIHHLRRLQSNGIVVVSRSDGLRRYYQAATPHSRARDEVTLLKQPTRRCIAHMVVRSPGISQADIVGRLGIGKAGVCKHLKTLEAECLIDGRTDGRLRRYRATAKLEETILLLEPATMETSVRQRSSPDRWGMATPQAGVPA